MNNKKFLEARKSVFNLADNWLDDESDCYIENLEHILKKELFKDCKYHIDLKNDKIYLSDIPTNKLCKGFNYTDLRILDDFFNNKNFFKNNLDKMT